MAGEQNVNISAGSGTGIDTFNVGTGAVGSGSEALRQAVVVSDAVEPGNVGKIDTSGRLRVKLHEGELAILMRAMLVRLDVICSQMDTHYTPPDTLGL